MSSCSVIPPLECPLLPGAARDMRTQPDNGLQRAHACYMHLLDSHLHAQLFLHALKRKRVRKRNWRPGVRFIDGVLGLLDKKKEHRLTVSVFENMVLRGIFGPEKLEKTS
jgi:hypothetical protein